MKATIAVIAAAAATSGRASSAGIHSRGCALIGLRSPTTPLRFATALPRLPSPLALASLSSEGGSGSEGSDGRSRLKKLITKLQKRIPAVAAATPLWVRQTVFRFRYLLMGMGAAFIVGVLRGFSTRGSGVPLFVEVSYAKFLSLASTEPSRISNLRISSSRYAFLLDGSPAYTLPVRAAPELLLFLHRTGVDFRAVPTSLVAGIIPYIFPLLYIGLMYSVIRKQMNGGSGSVGKRAVAKRLETTNLSFDDVAGVDAARAEVQEVVAMLREPERYAAVGARVPSGVLMVGPPGTGKTLLARVMSAQAQVPFFYCSGSDFVEMFVGRGAARMRALFKEAAAAAPCVIFIDELDALGKQRSMRLGGNDEAEQTLNQMLACMDGLETSNNGVVVMGATNRVEILDPALTRPGRFDRLVRMDLPDEAGRLAIMRVHTRNFNLDPDVQLARIATASNGLSGAELAALANEAAIRSVRRQGATVNMADFTSALLDFTASRRRGIGSLVSKLVGS